MFIKLKDYIINFSEISYITNSELGYILYLKNKKEFFPLCKEDYEKIIKFCEDNNIII